MSKQDREEEIDKLINIIECMTLEELHLLRVMIENMEEIKKIETEIRERYIR